MSETNELSVTTFIDAAPEQVWTIMTERLTEWWCPKPWRTEIVEIDWRPGGRSAMVMRGPNAGEEHAIEGVILDYVPGSHWTSTDAFSVGWVPQTPFMIGTWRIEAEGGGTRYTASARHWTVEAMEQHRDMGFTDGWNACAAQLKELAESGD